MRLALLLLAASAFAQIVVTPTTCNFTLPQYGPQDYSCTLTLTGTGSWTSDTSGYGGTYVNPSSGTGPATVTVRTISLLTSAVGSYPGSIVVAGTTITINGNVVRKYPNPVATNYMGVVDSSLSGCSNTGASPDLFWFFNSCPASPLPRPGGTYDMPTLGGGNVVDGRLGGTFRMISPVRQDYTNFNLFSADETLWISGTSEGTSATRGIYYTSGAGRGWPHPKDTYGAAYDGCEFLPTSSTVIYCTGANTGASIRKVTLGAPGTLIDGGAAWTSPLGTNITNGGSNAISKDGWQCAYPAAVGGQPSRLWAIEVTTGRYAEFDLTTLSPALGSVDPIDYCLISAGTESANGKNYIFVGVDAGANTYKAGRIFSVDPVALTITYEGLGPSWSEAPFRADSVVGPMWQRDCTASESQSYPSSSLHGCIQGGHGSTIEVQGTQYLLLPCERNGGNYAGFTCAFRFANGQWLSTPAILGGGQSWLGIGVAHEMGARRAPYVAGSYFSDTGKALLGLTACTAGASTVCTTSAAHGWSAGQAVIIGGVKGMTGLTKGTYTLSAASGSSISIPVSTTGTYTGGGGVSTDVAYDTAGGFEIIVHRLGANGRSIQTFRGVKHRSSPYGNTTENYGYNPFPTISPSGRYVNFNSNGGYPGETAAYMWDLGEGLPMEDYQFTATKEVSAAWSDTRLLLTVDPASQAAVSCSLSLQPDLSSPTTLATTAGVSSQVLEFGSLTASTYYYWRCRSSDDRYVAVGEGRTLPTQSGTATVDLAVGSASATSVAFDYGTSTSYGSTATATGCTIGQRCAVSISGTRGAALYWRAQGAAAATVVR